MSRQSCTCSRQLFTLQPSTCTIHARAPRRSSTYSSISSTSSLSSSPPSQGRTSLDRSMPPPRSTIPRSGHTTRAAINSAFASDEESAELFPASTFSASIPHRRRASPRESMSSTPVSASAQTAGSNGKRHPHTIARRLSPELSASSSGSRSSSESSGERSDSGRVSECHDRNYSPMAAGFARLAKEKALTSTSHARNVVERGRQERGRSSLELEAKMFDGPA